MTTREEQIETILDHYENPRHHGAMDRPDVVAKGGNPGCGDLVTLYLRIGEGGRIDHVCFEGHGCTISQAAASMLTEKIVNRPLADVPALDHEAFVEQLGADIVTARLQCAMLALNTLKSAAAKYSAGSAPRNALDAEVELFS